MILVSYLAKLIFVFYTPNMWSMLLKHVIRLKSPTQESRFHVERSRDQKFTDQVVHYNFLDKNW